MSAPNAAPAAGAPVLNVAGVSKHFVSGERRIDALRDVSLRALGGRVTGLIGPDAAGKTTLMRLIAGLLEPDSGAITVLGLDAAREPLAVQAELRYMPQRFGLYEDLSVQENLDLYADLQGVAPDDRSARYRELMHMTGLAPFTRRLAGRLSGGMKQKLGLACTLVRPPRLLLLDEPTVGVDPVSRRELWEIVYRLVREQGMSVLLSTAYLDEAERCDEVALLLDGELLGHGPPQAFTRDVRYRSYAVTAPGLKKRVIQQRLARAPGVIDAVVQSDAVRLVLDQDAAAAAERLLPGVDAVRLQPVEARFEDSFVALVRARRGEPAVAAGSDDVVEAAADGDRAVIEIHNLERRFGEFYAVRNLSFEVRRGEVFGLLGANGAGKSTTFRMLCGLLPPSGGEARVAGVDLRRARARARARIGYMAQKFSLYGNLSVLQNLRFFSRTYGLDRNRSQNRIAWALDRFDLHPVANANSETLSLGYKQRLALAAALMHEPDILFLDEPTSGVDPLARREFWQRINALAEHGVTVLVTTHFMEEAEYCDRLAIMAAGEILALGSPESIKARAAIGGVAAGNVEEAFIRLIEQQPAGAEAA